MNVAIQQNEKSYDLHAREWEASINKKFGHTYLEKPALEAEATSVEEFTLSLLMVLYGDHEELPEICELVEMY